MEGHLDLVTRRRGLAIILVLVLMAGAFWSGVSCRSSAPALSPTQDLPKAATPGAPLTPRTLEITIEGFAFNPVTISVPLGSAVIWQNKDSVPHTVTARDNLFDSSTLSRGDTFSYTFKQKGTFGYYCKIHPYMAEQVVVD